MTNRFEDFWVAADDGGSLPVGFEPPGAVRLAELDLLMDAWYRERAGRVESELLLEQARRLIVRLLADSDPGPARRRQVGRLFRAIRDVREGLQG